MSKHSKQAWSTAFLAATLGFSSVAAAQQDSTAGSQASSEAADGAVLEEVVVTANKREESANRVGMSITPLSRDELDARGIDTLEGLASVVPGMVF